MSPNTNGGDKPQFAGRAVHTIDEAIRTINWIGSKPDTLGVYACMSRQSMAEERVTANGFKYLNARKSQANAIDLKSIFLDIDFKDYKDKHEAVREFARFLKESNLPKSSVLVQSGNGLHSYWTFDRALTPADWLPLSYALVEAVKRHGLRADTGCSIDAARLLRVPGTISRKYGDERQVQLAGAAEFDYSVETIEKALEPYKTRVPALPVPSEIIIPAPSPSVLAKFAGFTNDLATGIERQYAPIKLTDIAKECAFVRDAIVNNGATYANPLWNLSTLVSTFTEGARADAHLMASGHPGYTKESTDALYDRKVKEKVEKGLGWVHCSTISAEGCTACQSCKHFAAGKTPFHFLDRPQPSPHLQRAGIEADTETSSFADPWAEFVGPAFPLSILPAPVANFVAAEHCAMAANSSAIESRAWA